MLFVVIEHFRGASVCEAYGRFNERGRLAPGELRSVGSWVTADLSRCFQIVEAEDLSCIQQWTANWLDLIEFEIFPVTESSAVRFFTDGVEAADPV
jgi:hypothetical protein